MTAEGSLGAAYDGLVVDLDGVVYLGPAPVPHAVDALRAVGRPVQYATNNAARRPADIAAHLRELGLDVSLDDVATSAQAAAASLARDLGPAARVLAVGGPGVAAALTEAGLIPVEPGDRDPVEGVLQGYGPRVSAEMLAEAAYAVQSGARWVATNVDLTLPTDRGSAPGNGALVAAVATACGRQPDDVVGKPYAALYDLCAARLGVAPGRVLAVGDRLDTDVAGAVRAGMDSLLVLTGVSTLVEALAAPVAQRPTWVAVDLRALHQPLSALSEGMSGRLRAAYAQVDAGRLTAQQAALLVAGTGVGDYRSQHERPPTSAHDMKERPMTMDSIRGLVQLASGLGEMTVAKANQTARDLAALAGLDEQLKKKKLSKQVSAIAQDLIDSASSNRNQVVSIVRAEVDKALARADLAKVGDLDTAKLGLASLMVQVEDLAAMVRSALPGASRSAAPTPPAAVDIMPDAPIADVSPIARKRPARRAFSGAADASASTAGAAKTATKRAPATKAATKTATTTAAKKAPATKTATAAKKAPATKTANKTTATTTAAKKAPATKTATRTAAKKAPATKTAKKAPAKKAGGS